MRMLSVADINRIRRRQRDRDEHNLSRLIGLGIALLLSLIIAITSISTALIYIDLSRDLPSPELIPALLEPPHGDLLQPTTFFDRTGEHVIFKLENPAIEERLFLDLDQTKSNYIPENLVSATIAVVEPNYWQEQGYSLNTLDWDPQDSITQRLVSDLLLWDEEASLRRDLRQRLLAVQTKSQFGPEKVLTWYLNNANYGRLTYGAESAAQVYYGKPASELNLAEAAVLAAVAEAPVLNPIDAPQAARERGDEVIYTMLAQGLITAGQAQAALESEVVFQPPLAAPSNLAPAFVNLIMGRLGEQFDITRIERGGLRIITTLDHDIQTQSACASKTLLARLEDTSGQAGSMQGEDCQAARLLPSIFYNPDSPIRDLGANVVVLDPTSGEILAMVGEFSAGLNPAQAPGHNTGSLISPIIYLSGFTQGLGPASLLWDIPPDSQADQLSDRQFMGPVRLRIALANDYLMPIQEVLAQVGTDKVLRLARQLGLMTAEIPQVSEAMVLLESSKATLLEISRAYGVFASQGILAGAETGLTNNSNNNHHNPSVTILEIADTHGRSWYEGDVTQFQPVISPQLAYLLTDTLSDQTARWPSMGHPNPLEIGRPAAAKMGTTMELRDAWTVGYIPELVVGVWIGHKDSNSSGRVPPDAAAALWHAIMQYASQETPAEGWQDVAGISKLTVCDPSGLLPSKDCPKLVNEVFLAGYEPTQIDTLYKRLQINRETGILATVFTSPELIEERVYLVVPPKASEWARQAGLPTPPDSYDVISSDINSSPNAEISSPGMFDYIRGKVEVTGTATSDEFVFYRIQVGEGLNPRNWLQVGEQVTNPVENDKLAVWDTSNLSGLYAIQLMVVDKEQHVEISTIQVTVDNQPPEVEIIHPSNSLELVDQETITIQTTIKDDLAVASVEFYIDNILIQTLYQPPFSIPWKTVQGEHILRVVVKDRAGNENKARVDFIVKE